MDIKGLVHCLALSEQAASVDDDDDEEAYAYRSI